MTCKRIGRSAAARMRWKTGADGPETNMKMDGLTCSGESGYTRGGYAVPGNMARELALQAALAVACLACPAYLALAFDTAGQGAERDMANAMVILVLR